MTVASVDFLGKVCFIRCNGVFSYLYVTPFLALCVKYVKNNIANKCIVIGESHNESPLPLV